MTDSERMLAASSTGWKFEFVFIEGVRMEEMKLPFFHQGWKSPACLFPSSAFLNGWFFCFRNRAIFFEWHFRWHFRTWNRQEWSFGCQDPWGSATSLHPSLPRASTWLKGLLPIGIPSHHVPGFTLCASQAVMEWLCLSFFRIVMAGQGSCIYYLQQRNQVSLRIISCFGGNPIVWSLLLSFSCPNFALKVKV